MFGLIPSGDQTELHFDRSTSVWPDDGLTLDIDDVLSSKRALTEQTKGNTLCTQPIQKCIQTTRMGFINILPKHFLNSKDVVDENPTSTNVNPEHFASDYYFKMRRPRLVEKSGELNIVMNNVPKHKRRLFRDMFNTILGIEWRWHVVFFLLSFMISWLVFAIGWYLIAFFHNDLEFNYKETRNSSNSVHNQSHIVCVSGNLWKLHIVLGGILEPVPFLGIHDFTTALLYSIETQHTIGYGFRHITEECPHAIMYLMLQSCFGIFVQGLVAGVVFAKISCPNKRKSTIIFSKSAVICKRDGNLCFQFKVGNIGKSQLADARIRILMIKSHVTDESVYLEVLGFTRGDKKLFFGPRSLSERQNFIPCKGSDLLSCH